MHGCSRRFVTLQWDLGTLDSFGWVSGLRTLLVVIGMCCCLSAELNTAKAQGIYAEQAFTQDQSEAELAKGAKQALTALLQRLTLETQLSAFESIIAQSDSLVKRAIFQDSDDLPSQGLRSVLYEFDAQALTRAVFEAGLGVVPEDRPMPVLWWTVLDDQLAPRFIDHQADQLILNALAESLARYDLTMTTPLFDLEDRRQLTPDAVWRSQTTPIVRAANRYGSAPQYVIQWAGLSNGQVIVTMSQITSKDLLISFERTFSSATAALQAITALIAADLRDQLAVTSDTTSLPLITFENLRGFDEYRMITRALEGSVFVTSMQVYKLVGRQLVLKVDSPVSREQLESVLVELLPLELVSSDADELRFEISR